MKNRHGFVSNSSSSSFIVDMPTVEDVLKYMLVGKLNSIHEDSDELKDLEEEKKDIWKVFETMMNFARLSEKEKTKDCSIAFHSCNFDTYIKKIEINGKNYIYVATCTNIDWELEKISAKGIYPVKSYYYDGILETNDASVHKSDIYQGVLDGKYIEGNEFYVIDNNNIPKIKVGNEPCHWIHEAKVIKE